MEIVPGKVQNRLRKLRKSLKRLPEDPSVESVHTLRTRARRVEAVSSTLMDNHKKKTRRLLKALKPVRKAAGQVRDMDVLIGKVLSLPHEESDPSLIRLVEHLGELRAKGERKLLGLIAARRKTASRNLKRYSRLAGKWLQEANGDSTEANNAPLALIAELTHWPKLSANNIHPFRIRVKELRYMLQLSEQPDEKLLAALDAAKNKIGDWHDWHELAQIAREILNPKTDHALCLQIKDTRKSTLDAAIAAANALREQHFLSPKTGREKKPPAAVRVDTSSGVILQNGTAPRLAQQA